MTPQPHSKAASNSEPLRDALADILDITLDWCRPMTDAEKLALIHKIAEKAWQEAA